MEVRAATEEDLPAIAAIYNHAVLHTTATADYQPQSLEARAAWLAEREQQGLPVIVAEEEGAARTISGWGALNRYHARPGYRFTVENSVYVAPAWQGRGVGGRLLARLVEEARARGIHAILAGIDGNNQASMRLHRRAGFREVARLREVVFKFDRWLDVVYLELLL